MELSTLKLLNMYPLLALSYFHTLVGTTISQPTNISHAFPAVLAFGDSVLDTGNNDYISTFLKANYKPYGRDFIGGKSTGRFSNGKIPSDFFAEMLGVKETLPPYLDPTLTIEDLLTGVCFASAGAGYDPLTLRLDRALSIDNQLFMFKEYIGKLKAFVGEEKTAFILANSVFLVSMGSNDISMTYFLTPFRRREYDIEGYTSMLVDRSSNFLQELYQLGARRIGVISLSPIGCVPTQRMIRGGVERQCVEAVNEAAILYNTKISSSVTSLNKDLPDARLVFLDNYHDMIGIIQQYSEYGFEVVDDSCCPLRYTRFGIFCRFLSFNICRDASKYVFWDGYHPTEKTYNILVSEAVKKYIDKFV